jgi:hypothetical protein
MPAFEDRSDKDRAGKSVDGSVGTPASLAARWQDSLTLGSRRPGTALPIPTARESL